MRKPRGHIRRHGAGYEVAVSADQDPITKRYRYLYEQVATVEEAEAVRDRLMYQGCIERTIRPVLGGMQVRELERRPDLLDSLYAALRRCRRLCGGLVDHRPAGRGKRREDGTPDHVCDERCRPHRCRPAEPVQTAAVQASARLPEPRDQHGPTVLSGSD